MPRAEAISWSAGSGHGFNQDRRTTSYSCGHTEGGRSKITSTASAELASDKNVTNPSVNASMHEAMEKIRARHKIMHTKDGKDSLEYLREAREGGMYGTGTEE